MTNPSRVAAVQELRRSNAAGPHGHEPTRAAAHQAAIEDDEYLTCAALVWAGTLETPPEYCEDEPEPDSDYCPKHQPYEPDPDDERDRLADLED